MALSEKHITEICKRGQGKLTCSYLAFGGDGFICAKNDPAVKAVIDQRRSQKTMNAMGDNCEGVAS
jgi:hypothetical protein